ncbi:hypothetical protein BJ875DRAFT_28290 [Amylocarpus encephaloides]|uniref:Uncharacterized protein n=1 Tax=Amylocarpus encephaloides TaxID=45428 RepID=A0A9P7YJA7_9HELO|nr:hypothetical protein BJ875DRAFT_28290 [Amylocarpus encephaloides]
MSDQHNDQRSLDPVQETADTIIGDILGGTRSREDISPSGQLYRFVERFHQSRRIENRAEQQLPSLHGMADPDPERRRRPHREAIEPSPLFVLPPQPQSERTERPPMSRERVAARLSELATSRRRPRMMSSDRHPERQRALGDGSAAASRNLIHDAETRDRVVRQMEEASNSSMQNTALENAHLELQELRARVDNSMASAYTSGIEYPSESSYPRVKRRKLDSDKMGSGFSGFSYGKYGQVEPGRLKMEIVSCDGGIFEVQHGAHHEDYEPENVLLDDTSVYCTKSNRCNLVLRHQGSTTFCLTEMVIKAPRQNYTAPIQEGLVFVSMTLDDLLTRTAKYQIQYSPPRPRRSTSERDPEDLPLMMSVRPNGDGSMSTAQARARRLYDIGLQDEDCDSRTAQMPLDFTSTAPGFTNTTECSDSEDETTPLNPSRSLRSVHRLMNRDLRFEGSDDSGDETPRNSNAPWHEEYLGIGRTPTLRRRETASNITLSEVARSNHIATQEPVIAVGRELMVPHARFFIERDKSKTTIKFDPPVSGRFILLKLWSPHPSPTENIDIQTVVAKGFAGPRFFPAVTLR